MATIDWNEAFDEADKPEELVPASTYNAKIAGANWKVSKSGNKMLEVRFEIADGGPFNGRALWSYITVNPSGSKFALQKSLASLADLGLDRQILTTTDEHTQENMLVGKLCSLTTEIGDWNGAPAAQVASFKVHDLGHSSAPPPAAAPPPVATTPPAPAAVEGQPAVPPPSTPPPAPFSS